MRFFPHAGLLACVLLLWIVGCLKSAVVAVRIVDRTTTPPATVTTRRPSSTQPATTSAGKLPASSDSFSSLAMISPAAKRHPLPNHTAAAIPATSNGMMGTLRLGDATYDVSCDCGENWTVSHQQRVGPKALAADKAPSCPTPNSYKVERLSREDLDEERSTTNDHGDDDDDSPFNSTQVISFLPLPSQLKFVNSTSVFLADMDGRSTTPVLGTPGGDLGEFVVGLQVGWLVGNAPLIFLHRRTFAYNVPHTGPITR